MKAPRLFYLLLFLYPVGLLAYGYYLQFAVGLEPCPLCIFQRLAYMAVAAFGLVGLLHGPEGIWLRIYSSGAFLAAIIGAGIAGWQIYLQHLPAEQVPECGPGLDYMLDVFPLTETIKMAFAGSGECAEVDWTFLGLSIAEWSLPCFLFIAAVTLLHTAKGRITAQI